MFDNKTFKIDWQNKVDELAIHFPGGHDFFIDSFDSNHLVTLTQMVNRALKNMSIDYTETVSHENLNLIIEHYYTGESFRFLIYFDKHRLRMVLDFTPEELKSFHKWLEDVPSQGFGEIFS